MRKRVLGLALSRPAAVVRRMLAPVGGLYLKFAILFIPVFAIACAVGLFALSAAEERMARDGLSARIGNKAGRIAGAVERQMADGVDDAAQAVLDTLLADVAVTCAELKDANGAGIFQTPQHVGCAGRTSGASFVVPVGAHDENSLLVRYTDAEIVAAVRLRREIALAVLLAALLVATGTTWLGFRVVIGSPLARLSAAIDASGGHGDRAAVAVVGHDEIARATRAYNALQSKIANLNTHLEARVRDRTRIAEQAAALAEHANDELRQEIEERARIADSLSIANVALERATRSKSDFLATMSHEIRTPMNGILGMLALLERTELSARQTHLAATAHNSARALLAILNDILDFSKLEAGKMSFEQRPLDMSQLIGETMSLFSIGAEQKGLQLTTENAGTLPTVHGDAMRVRQVLVNLVGNAVKFTASGSVTVRVSTPRPRTLRVEVDDTGIGMAPETLGHLFTPFMQEHVTTTHRFGGTGLGLAICHKLVTAMGGRIGATSRQGLGSTFWFELATQGRLERQAA